MHIFIYIYICNDDGDDDAHNDDDNNDDDTDDNDGDDDTYTLSIMEGQDP
jgi:hypothetical protein